MKRSKGKKYPEDLEMLLNYVDSHKDDLLIPSTDGIYRGERKYASAKLKPFEDIIGYEKEELSIIDLNEELLSDPLSAESITWIVRKLTWLKENGSKIDAEIDTVLGNIGIPLKQGGDKFINEMKAVEVHAGNKKGRKEVEYILSFLNSSASSDMKLLAIAMKESRERMVILLTDDYDLFALPIWNKVIVKSECSRVTMVVGRSDVRWIVVTRDGSTRVLNDKKKVRELYSEEEYLEVIKALQIHKPTRIRHKIRAHYNGKQGAD